MAKTKKSELTLEELQAKKSKTQRGWVRFCAILLAVLLTVGIYGVASRGEPNVVKLRSGVVRTNTQTVVKQEPTVTPATTPDTNTSNTTPPASDDEGGGILETIMNLLGGIDFSKIAGMLDFNGLGVKVADGIDKAADSLLTLVDKLESSITKKPVITHEAEEEDFPENVNIGDAARREAIVALLNEATAKAEKAGTYTLSRTSNYVKNGNYGVSVGEATETINSVLGAVPQGDGKEPLSLDTLVAQFNGVGTEKKSILNGNAEKMNENYLLMATKLKASDIAILTDNKEAGTYRLKLKSVADPNRQADCGLTRLTNDYLVQNELAPKVAALATTNNEAFSLVKLSDLEMKYSEIYVDFTVDSDDNLTFLRYEYESYGKFTVRTNTLQVVGAATTTTTASYSNFVY